jgi:hypothetical protein
MNIRDFYAVLRGVRTEEDARRVWDEHLKGLQALRPRVHEELEAAARGNVRWCLVEGLEADQEALWAPFLVEPPPPVRVSILESRPAQPPASAQIKSFAQKILAKLPSAV